jgi:YHS domain-containing protein
MGRLIASVLLVASLLGCASKPAAQDGQTAECCICRENGDLACLHVKVTGATPRAEYGGRTWYFCSEECREAFLKNPAKYAEK